MLLNQQIPGQIPHNRATSKHHDKQDMRIQYGTQLQAANGGNQPIWPAAQGNYTQLRCSVLIHYMLFPSFTFHSITDNPPLISSSFNFIQHFKISNPIIALLTNFYIITSLPNVNHSTKTALLYIYDHLINANGSLKISRPYLLVPVCCLWYRRPQILLTAVPVWLNQQYRSTIRHSAFSHACDPSHYRRLEC